MNCRHVGVQLSPSAGCGGAAFAVPEAPTRTVAQNPETSGRAVDQEHGDHHEPGITGDTGVFTVACGREECYESGSVNDTEPRQSHEITE